MNCCSWLPNFLVSLFLRHRVLQSAKGESEASIGHIGQLFDWAKSRKNTRDFIINSLLFCETASYNRRRPAAQLGGTEYRIDPQLHRGGPFFSSQLENSIGRIIPRVATQSGAERTKESYAKAQRREEILEFLFSLRLSVKIAVVGNSLRVSAPLRELHSLIQHFVEIQQLVAERCPRGQDGRRDMRVGF